MDDLRLRKIYRLRNVPQRNPFDIQVGDMANCDANPIDKGFTSTNPFTPHNVRIRGLENLHLYFSLD